MADASSSIPLTTVSHVGYAGTETSVTRERSNAVLDAVAPNLEHLTTDLQEAPARVPEDTTVNNNVQQNRTLSNRRLSKRFSAVFLKNVLHQDPPSTKNLATPNDVEEIRAKNIQLHKAGDSNVFVTKKAKLLGSEVENTFNLNNMDKVKHLANGATAVVFRAISAESNDKTVILKFAKAGDDATKNKEKVEDLERDYKITKHLNGGHKKTRGIQQTPHKIFELKDDETRNKMLGLQKTKEGVAPVHGISSTVVAVAEYSGGSLDSQLGSLTPNERTSVALDLAYGMVKMKEKEVYNFDIKLENVLIEKKGGRVEAGLSDFGEAHTKDQIKRNPQLLADMGGTPYTSNTDDRARILQALYKRDEALENKDTKGAAKVVDEALKIADQRMAFAFGATLFHLFTAEPSPTDRKNVHFNAPFVVNKDPSKPNEKVPTEEFGEVVSTKKGPYDFTFQSEPEFNRAAFPPGTPDEIIDIVQGLMHPDPAQRMTVEQAQTKLKAFEKGLEK